MIKWVKHVIRKRQELRIPDPSTTPVVGGNSLSPKSLPHLTYGDLIRFYANPSFETTITDSLLIRVTELSGYGAYALHHAHVSSML